MNLHCTAAAWALALWLPMAALAESGPDPLASARWPDMKKAFLADAPVRFDERVRVLAPADAENPLQVPVSVDATGLAEVRQVMILADFNPIPLALKFYPQGAAAFLGFRLKLQQSSPVRAAVLTADGVWHLGGTWVNTVGGGCTAPAAGSASPDWQQQLNQVNARVWSDGPLAGRLRLKVMHPMDTGLVAGIPAFHLEQVEVEDGAGRLLMRIEPFEPVSENPVFTLQQLAGQPGQKLLARGRDNNGNQFSVGIAP